MNDDTERKRSPQRMKNMDTFFEPRNVAIIGASRDGDKIGHAVMRNFVENRFFGEIYPVNPNADSIMGHPCFDAVSDIPEHVDLAVVAVPATVANETIRDAVDAGVNSIIVITSGYREIGGDGEKRSEELNEILDGADTRLIGPNGLGVWDAYNGVDTLFLPSYKLQRPPQGDIAIISQSGAFGSTVMDLLADMGVGVSRFVSYGNQADVTETELIEWLRDDDKTNAIAVYMEGAADGRDFLDTVKDVSHDMPVIVLKGGKHDEGAAAAASHTGSLAGSYNVYNGVFKQTGVLEAPTIEDLFDYARALAHNEPLDGNNIAVVTNGGGFGVLASDALVSNDMALAEFSDETVQQLEDIVPSYGTVGNPLDLIGDADADRFEAALRILVEDDNIDGILVMPLLQPLPLNSDVVDAIANVREDYEKPLVTCLTGSEFTQLHMKNLERNKIAAYSAPERAANALAALGRYGEWLRANDRELDTTDADDFF